jgi:menaquinone-dependent protoporphyrinogen oxidase
MKGTAMRILVTVASKHGATFEIAEVISDVLSLCGLDSVTMSVEDATLDGFDAVIIGSAVYAGHWRNTATDFVHHHEQRLRAMPVWLFSSGPIGDPPKPAEDPAGIADLVAASGAREHQVFAGMLDKRQLGFAERAVVATLRSPIGDFRDFGQVRAWADGIAEALRALDVVP